MILLVEVAGRRFGIPGDLVGELLRAVAIEPLPSCPQSVEGVVNLRGRLVPVLALRTWLGIPPKPLDPADHFVVVRAGEGQAVLRVDRAIELVPADSAEIAAPAALPGLECGCRVANLAGDIVLLPDLAGLLANVRAEAVGGAFQDTEKETADDVP